MGFKRATLNLAKLRQHAAIFAAARYLWAYRGGSSWLLTRSMFGHWRDRYVNILYLISAT